MTDPPTPAAPASSPSEQQGRVSVPRRVLEALMPTPSGLMTPDGRHRNPYGTCKVCRNNNFEDAPLTHQLWCPVPDFQAALAQPQPAAAAEADGGLRAGSLLSARETVAASRDCARWLRAEDERQAARWSLGGQSGPFAVAAEGLEARAERLEALGTPAPQAQAEAGAGLSPEVLAWAQEMQRELDANSHKGAPGSWRYCSPEVLWNDTMYHAAKLIYAMKHGETDKVREFVADTAVMAMMTGDAWLHHHPADAHAQAQGGDR